MKEKLGVTAIIFDEQDGKRFFLLLHRVLNWSGWEFCKGGVEPGEKLDEAVLRECLEETGIEASIVAQLPKKVIWTHLGNRYIYSPFILRASMSSNVDLQQQIIEHDAYRWVNEASVERFLRHADNKKNFREALKLLNQLAGKSTQ